MTLKVTGFVCTMLLFSISAYALNKNSSSIEYNIYVDGVAYPEQWCTSYGKALREEVTEFENAVGTMGNVVVETSLSQILDGIQGQFGRSLYCIVKIRSGNSAFGFKRKSTKQDWWVSEKSLQEHTACLGQLQKVVSDKSNIAARVSLGGSLLQSTFCVVRYVKVSLLR